MGDTSAYRSTKTWKSDADETLNATWSWSCYSKEVISSSLNTSLKLCPCVSYLCCHLLHCVKQGTREKADTENKWESKVLVEVKGRRKGSMPDFRVCCCLAIIFMYLSFLEELFSVICVDFICLF